MLTHKAEDLRQSGGNATDSHELIAPTDSHGGASVSTDPPYKLPNPWQAYKNKFKDLFGSKLPNVGVVFIGRGNEQFALKTLKDGYIGVWKIGDPGSIM